jgi:hypothetical protein
VTFLIAGFASKPEAADDVLHRALGEKSGIAILTDEYLEVRADDSRVPPTFADIDMHIFAKNSSSISVC